MSSIGPPLSEIERLRLKPTNHSERHFITDLYADSFSAGSDKFHRKKWLKGPTCEMNEKHDGGGHNDNEKANGPNLETTSLWKIIHSFLSTRK
jgi:hypothetical protein